MDIDDVFGTSPKKDQATLGEDLSQLSIEELTERTALLKEEMRRVRREIDARGNYRNAAEDIFKS
ncbi:MAG: DUF1192 domain-containing protein [Pseudomonadota bacterium]